MWPFRGKDLTVQPDLEDPLYPGLAEKTIAAAKPPPATGTEISLDGQPSVRLQTRDQPGSCPRQEHDSLQQQTNSRPDCMKAR
jgi:hypothetical protein